MSGPSSVFYDEDVSSKASRNSSGISPKTAQIMLVARRCLDDTLLPFNRTLRCLAKNPIFLPFDGTRSMGKLPMMFRDRAPNLSYQMQTHRYLPEPQMCLAIVGDCTSDKGPIQVADFSVFKGLSKQLGQIWLEREGGLTAEESYEFHAYFGAYRIVMPKAVNPFCIFTGDESFRDVLEAADLNKYFGGQNQTTTAEQAFSDLRRNFHDNVFLLHRCYTSHGGLSDTEIVSKWTKVLGRERIILLPEDEAIVDTVLGILAIMGGSRTLEAYCYDMAHRKNANTGEPEPQTRERISMIRVALRQLEEIAPSSQKVAAVQPEPEVEPELEPEPEPTEDDDPQWI
jgi:hypothetical protein